jgi:CARDB
MKSLVAAALAATLIVSSSAGAAQVPKDKVGVRLTTCDAVLHSATFQGTMQAFGGATTLQMRFTLQARDPARSGKWARVGAPKPFEEWLTAATGITRYVYDKGVDNLPVGLSYRAVVRFRFRAADGTLVGRAVRHSKRCRQPDNRPDLQPVRLRGGDVLADGTRSYQLTMTNAGKSASGPTSAALDVNGVRVLVNDPGLAPGATTTLDFLAPACPTGSSVTATVDAYEQVDERDEDDNALTVPCLAIHR